MVNDTENDAETSAEQEGRTGQIPLLDEVVLDTDLPFPKPKRTMPKPADTGQESVEPQKVPRATDLFGGSPETAASGPLASDYEVRDIDQLRADTEQMVDHLVAEYSQEIVSRLKQELTSLLDDLNDPEKR